MLALTLIHSLVDSNNDNNHYLGYQFHPYQTSQLFVKMHIKKHSPIALHSK